uniref:Uncharacterized protein n=1 Tax=Phaeodactylum tricornutum TaxID=2850 RepID=A0A8J9T7C0_PHATR
MPPLTTSKTPTEAEKNLQDKLHDLLTRLSQTMELVKSWPEDKGSPSVHVENATKLIAAIRHIVNCSPKSRKHRTGKHCFEENIAELCDTDRSTGSVRSWRRGGVHPDCFSRGLLQEALGQLAGLKRRKLALEMLGSAVQAGLTKKKRTVEADTVLLKRERPELLPGAALDENPAEPSSKRQRIQDTSAP